MASSEKNYPLFLSFRGTDVHNNFLHDLYAALNQKGIYTFVDSEEIRKGEQIWPAFMRVIEELRVAIIIFSEDYASSQWCLEELAKIMECKAWKELIVLPVFYNVEPREVRGAREGYGRAMAKHESDSEKDRKTVERWKKALFDAGSLSGWVCNDGDEADIIQSIVKELPIRLQRTPLLEIDSHVEELISWSQKESDGDDVLMIGICGPGGLGKTAIAKAIYKAIETQFQVAIFLERVRGTSNKCDGLVELQDKLLSQITSHKHPTVYSEGRGSSLIRENLPHKKVLLVLDDVDDRHQLDMLAGGGDWFGKGSRIFVTTRYNDLVISSHCKNRVYPVNKRKYRVFVSFRGRDVRNNFLPNLDAALNQKGIDTFVDSKGLRKGEQILPALMRAIEESRAVIIIFSEDYASSQWCLKELAKIMECKAQKELIVLPVFYKVEPREVRRGRKGYGIAMAKHESDSEKDAKAVETWKKALFNAGNLSGWVCSDGDEAEVIQSIVKELPIFLERTPLDVAKYPVGIESRVEQLLPLSQKELDGDDILMIGIWGPGGIGKTVIAKAIYNAIEGQFQGAIFLERVRETSNKCNGLVELQRRLLSQILPPKHLMVYSVAEGINLIKERLYCKKVLLVLDDVDQLDQLNALVGQGNWFGKGSRIFVTSRDRHLLTSSHCKNCVYEVETLKNDEARDLFVWHAFPNSKKVEIREDLIDRALHYASGLPLALEVLGSFLHGRNEPAWESVLSRLNYPRVLTQISVKF